MNGYAPMVYADSLLYVPTDERLTAIDVRDGRVVWDRTRLKSNPEQLESTRAGLLVRMPHIDLLDPRTGVSRWPRAFTELEHSTPFVVRDDNVYVAAEGAFYRIELASGSATELSRYELRETKQPEALEVVPGGFVLRTAQNVIIFDSAGVPTHRLFYPPPKLSPLVRVAYAAAAIAISELSYAEAKAAAARTGEMQTYVIVNPILSRRYGASKKARDYYYVLTVFKEPPERTGPGLVKLNVVTGKEESRLWLGDRTPEYEVDAIESIVFFKQGKRELAAFRM
jgi:hypothetical protein